MNEPASNQFLDVSEMLSRSHPRRPPVRLWQVFGLFLILVLISTWVTSNGGQGERIMSVVSGVVMIGLVTTLAMMSWILVRRARAEQLQLEAIEELIRLRRWSEAALMVQGLLMQPTRTPQARLQGLVFLTSVLARYNRFDDTIIVQNYLLEKALLDPGTTYGLKLARALAMLHEDRLFDADRAIAELRQQARNLGRVVVDDENETEESAPQPTVSAALVLIEIYRDVKTGHPQEAIDLFNKMLVPLRDQLGQRIADVYALIAKAYDLLGNSVEAQSHFEKATLLAPPAELQRRFPETASLAATYQAATAPKEAA